MFNKAYLWWYQAMLVFGFNAEANASNSNAGKKGGDAKKQCLFVPFIQAVSVVCTGQAGGDGCLNRSQARRLRQQQLGRDAAEGRDEGGLNYLPPSMQTFQEMDLNFIRTFTEVWGSK